MLRVSYVRRGPYLGATCHIRHDAPEEAFGEAPAV